MSGAKKQKRARSTLNDPKHRELIEAALEAVKTGTSIRGAAKQFGVSQSTLGDKVRGVTPMKLCEKTSLLQEEEAKLVAWIKECTKKGREVDQNMLRAQVRKILAGEQRKTKFVNLMPSKSWYYRFLARHPDIGLKKTQYSGMARARVTESGLRGLYRGAEKNLLETGCDVAAVDGSRISNCKETGVSLYPAPASRPLPPPPPAIGEPQSHDSLPSTSTATDDAGVRATSLIRLLLMVRKWDDRRFFSVMRQQNECVDAASTSDVEFAEFQNLWKQLVPVTTFNSLPLPQGLKSRGLRLEHRFHPPKFVSGADFKTFFEEKQKEQREKEKEKDRKKRAREKRKRKKMAEKERKRVEMEERKANSQKRKEKRMLKHEEMKSESDRENECESKEGESDREKESESEEGESECDRENESESEEGENESESDRENECESEDGESESDRENECVSVYLDESSCDSMMMFDNDTCHACGEKNNDYEWVGCGCGRWFHVPCACSGGRNDELMDLSEQELIVFKFVCDFCV